MINLDQLLVLDGGKRKKWLEGQAQASLPAKAARALKTWCNRPLQPSGFHLN